MQGKRVNISAPSNGAVDETFLLNTNQSVSAWSFVAYIYDTSEPSVSLGAMTCTVDSTEKTVRITYEASAVAALLGTATSGSYGYCVLCRPNTTTGRQFFYGTLTITTGGPAWAA